MNQSSPRASEAFAPRGADSELAPLEDGAVEQAAPMDEADAARASGAPAPSGVAQGRRELDAPAVRRQALLLSCAAGAAALFCGLLWTQHHAAATELAGRRARGAALVADAQTITALRKRPAQAADTATPVGDLLATVTAAMQSAGVPPASLVATLPQPLRALPGATHAERAVRLVFEDVGLEALARFCGTLCAARPELRIAGLQLRAGRAVQDWNVDVSVAQTVVRTARTP